MSQQSEVNYTIENCADEPIHRPEAIQSYGYLLGIGIGSGCLEVYSANVSDLFSVPISFGETRFEDLLDEPSRHCFSLPQLIERLDERGQRDSLEVHFDSALLQAPDWVHQLHCVAYRSGEYVVVEVEPTRAFANNVSSGLQTGVNLRKALPDLFQLDDVSTIAQHIAEVVKNMTGYDRVMVYKFDHLYNGHVLAEARESPLEPFLGMHFPASDIPAQARRLYEINWIRMITDIDSAPVELLPNILEQSRPPLDLSDSLVRAVSPIHIQYLRNMGVQATMSISLMQGERLWGLIACHHYSPRYVDQKLRLECEALGQLYAWQLNAKEAELVQKSAQRRVDMLESLISELASHDDFLSQLTTVQSPLLALMNACGFAIFAGGSTIKLGQVPSDDEIEIIIDSLAVGRSDEIVSSHCIARDLDEKVASATIGGALVLPLSFKHNYFAVWFRPKVVYTIDWAGKDALVDKAALKDPAARLTPRGSFSLWRQTVEDESEQWSFEDVQIAARFNRLLVENVIEKKVMVEQTLDKLRRLDETKDQFLASVSHELRSPLNAIMGWSELALHKRDDHDKAIEALEVIQRSAKSQAQLINDLLDVSRIVSGKMKLSIQNLNLSEIAEDVVNTFRAATQSKDIKLVLVFDNQGNTIYGDPLRINQILTNLLSNAIKFTPKHGKISVLGRKDNSSFIIEVADTGRGIDEQDLPHVFERFYQPEHAQRKHGLGLGLSIVKHLVELHGGIISADSAGPGKGATFTLRFPISPVNVQPELTAGDRGLDQSAVLEARSEDDVRLSGLHILAVEDEEDANRFISMFLTRHGARVTSARNGLEAWRLLEQNPEAFDLLLTDIGMPEMDGYELIERVRNSGVASLVRLNAVALTAYAYSTDRIKALKAGFTSYVSKPVDGEELVTVIEMTGR